MAVSGATGDVARPSGPAADPDGLARALSGPFAGAAAVDAARPLAVFRGDPPPMRAPPAPGRAARSACPRRKEGPCGP